MTRAAKATSHTQAKRPTFCGTPVTDDEWSVLREIIVSLREDCVTAGGSSS